MNYLSTEPFTSTPFPSVTVKLRKMSQRRRAEFNLTMASLLAKAREIAIRNEPIEQEYVEFLKASEAIETSNKALAAEEPKATLPVFPDDKLEALQQAWTEQRRFEQDEMSPPLLRWGVASIEGLTIDDKPADVESLIDAGPPELTEELAKEVTRVMRLSSAEIKNSESPTTSGAVADGATSSSTALPADPGIITSSATATASIPS
jgi:hypothetical protein